MAAPNAFEGMAEALLGIYDAAQHSSTALYSAVRRTELEVWPRERLEAIVRGTEPEPLTCPACGAKLVDAGTTSKGQVYEHDERPPRARRCPFVDAAYSLEEMRAGVEEEPDEEPGPGYDERIEWGRTEADASETRRGTDDETRHIRRALGHALDVLESHDRKLAELV